MDPIVWIRGAGILGALVSAAVGVCDLILLPRETPTGKPGLGALHGVSHRRLVWGGAAGTALLPLMAAGMWHMYQGLSPAGVWLAAPPPILLTYFFCAGAAAHLSFAYFGTVIKEWDSHGGDSNIRNSLDAIQRDQLAVFLPLMVLTIAAFCIGSFWLLAAIMSGQTRYPKWFGALNPLLLAVPLLLSYRVATPRVSRILAAPFVHLIFCPLFLLSTFLLWDVR